MLTCGGDIHVRMYTFGTVVHVVHTVVDPELELKIVMTGHGQMILHEFRFWLL